MQFSNSLANIKIYSSSSEEENSKPAKEEPVLLDFGCLACAGTVFFDAGAVFATTFFWPEVIFALAAPPLLFDFTLACVPFLAESLGGCGGLVSPFLVLFLAPFPPICLRDFWPFGDRFLPFWPLFVALSQPPLLFPRSCRGDCVFFFF